MERDADGPRRAVGTHTDISVRKQTEAALAASQVFAQSLIDASPDWIKTIDGNGRVVTINDSARRAIEAHGIGVDVGGNWRTAWNDAGAGDADHAFERAGALPGRTLQRRGHSPLVGCRVDATPVAGIA